MTLAKIAKEIEEFTTVRNWDNSDPNELLVALNTELGELGEHFLWKKSFAENYNDEEKKELAFEMVDIMIYLLQIANKCEIEDLGIYYKEKIKKLGKKYPVDITRSEWKQKHEEYKKSGMNRLYE